MSTNYDPHKKYASMAGPHDKTNKAKTMKGGATASTHGMNTRGSIKTAGMKGKSGDCPDIPAARVPTTVIANCVQEELRRYFDLLDGEEPNNVYHLVMRQAERALIESVMHECGGNQSKATKWLGISRGNLRNKLADMGYV